ncbi:MAG: tetratricopeptide repeat protein [Alphaproteobacteria bacterium]
MVSEQQDPEFLPILLKLSEFFLIGQQTVEANIRIDKILTIDPQHATAHALKASIFLRDKAFNQAQQEIDLSFKYDPSNLIAYSVQAGMYMAQKEYETALQILDKGIALNPKEPSLYLLKASIYSEQDNPQGVTDVYETLFEIFPDRITYRFDLAQILKEFSKTEEARKVYQDAVSAFPDNGEAKLKLVQYLEVEKGMGEAKKEIQSFINAKPDQKLFYLWLADIYTRNNEHENAILTLKNIIDTDPDDWIGLNAQTNLAQIELSRGDIQLANDLITAVLEKEVNNIDAFLLRANLSFIQGDHRKAIQDLRTILNRDPKFLKASRTLAEALLIQGHNDLAIDTLLQALEKTPDDKGTLVRLAQLHALRGEHDTAINILTQVTDIFPNYSVAWESIARTALEVGQVTVAENAIKELQKINGKNPLSKFLFAKADIQNGSKQKASDALKAIIRDDINSPLSAHALSTLLETAQSKESLDDVKSFLVGLRKHNSLSFTILGAINMQTGNMEDAEVAFRKAINLNPKSHDAYTSLAKILLDQNLPQNAIEVLEAAEQAIPSEAGASMFKAIILTQIGEIDQAIAIYEAAIERSDVADASANNMAQVIADFKYKDTALLKKARIIAERFINSPNPNHLDTLGWVYYRSNLPIQAQPILEKAIKLQTTHNPQISFHYGAVLKANGNLEQAKIYLQQATSKNVSYEGIDEARRLLEGLK